MRWSKKRVFSLPGPNVTKIRLSWQQAVGKELKALRAVRRGFLPTVNCQLPTWFYYYLVLSQWHSCLAPFHYGCFTESKGGRWLAARTYGYKKREVNVKGSWRYSQKKAGYLPGNFCPGERKEKGTVAKRTPNFFFICFQMREGWGSYTINRRPYMNGMPPYAVGMPPYAVEKGSEPCGNGKKPCGKRVRTLWKREKILWKEGQYPVETGQSPVGSMSKTRRRGSGTRRRGVNHPQEKWVNGVEKVEKPNRKGKKV